MFSSIVRGLIIPAAVALLFGWFRRHVPGRQLSFGSKHDNINSAASAPYVAVAQVVAGLAFALLSFEYSKLMNYRLATLAGPPQFLLPADTVFWWFLSLFGGLTLAWEITYRVWGLFDRDAADAYIAYSDEKTGFGATQVLRWMTVLLTMPIAVATILCLRFHASFYQDGFQLERFAHFKPEFHPYSSVRRFELVDGDLIRDGSFSARPRLILTFQDGTAWDSFRTREDRPVDPQLVSYLTTKLGRAPDHLHTSPNLFSNRADSTVHLPP